MKLYFDEQKPIDVLVTARVKLRNSNTVLTDSTVLKNIIGVSKIKMDDTRYAYSFMYEPYKSVMAIEGSDALIDVAYHIEILSEVSGNA